MEKKDFKGSHKISSILRVVPGVWERACDPAHGRLSGLTRDLPGMYGGSSKERNCPPRADRSYKLSGNITLTLTKHFEDRWREYFREPPPSSMQALRILSQSIWLQGCRVLYEADGKEYKQLASYWHPKKSMIIKVDWVECQVVTLITPKTKRRGNCFPPEFKDMKHGNH